METFRSSPEPSAEEAAAVITAIEQYLRDTKSPPEPSPSPDPKLGPWKRAALAEGIARRPELPH
jgi:hypothetical protein